MQLMTEEIAARLRAARAANENGDADLKQAEIVVKYFYPAGAATWWVIEGEETEDGDWLLYGYATLGLGPECDELGYVALSELQNFKGKFGLGIERDLHYVGHTLEEVMS